jgi:hypothetical protein
MGVWYGWGKPLLKDTVMCVLGIRRFRPIDTHYPRNSGARLERICVLFILAIIRPAVIQTIYEKELIRIM